VFGFGVVLWVSLEGSGVCQKSLKGTEKTDCYATNTICLWSLLLPFLFKPLFLPMTTLLLPFFFCGISSILEEIMPNHMALYRHFGPQKYFVHVFLNIRKLIPAIFYIINIGININVKL